MRSEYLKWKRKNITYRGTSDVEKENGAGAALGRGLYTASLSNKKMAKEYGNLYFVLNARPKNPKKFKTKNDWEIWFYNTLVYNYLKEKGLLVKNFPDRRDFEKHTSIEKELLKLGFDGVEIIGREIVNFTPQDIRYFTNEKQVENYYYDFVKK